MKVRDCFVQGRRRWVRLHEKGSREHDFPCHHNLDQFLHEYIDAAGIAAVVDGYLFRTARRKSLQPIPSSSRTPTASSAGARKRLASKRGLAITPSARPASRRI